MSGRKSKTVKKGKPLSKRLDDIRKTNCSVYEKRQEIVAELKSELRSKGNFIKTSDGRAYYFSKSMHKLYEILAENETFDVMLYELAGLNKADKDWSYILNDLRNYTLVSGKESSVWQFCRWQENKLYLSRFDGTMYVLDGKNALKKDNGTDGVLFLDRPEWEPWTRKHRKGSFSLKDFSEQVNFDAASLASDGLTTDEYRKLFIVCLLFMFFPELLPTKPLILFLGEKGSGKTSTIRRIGKLLFGGKFDVKTLGRNREDAFTVLVASHFLVALDNMDISMPWLCDTVGSVRFCL